MTASVTVCTPHLPDRGDFLREACESVRSQTTAPWAHLISVDYQHEGPAVHLNALIASVRTEWAAILPDDDLFHPDHLGILLHHAEPDTDLVYSWGRFVGRDDNDDQYRGEFNAFRLMNRKDVGIRGVFMVRRAAWERIGGYDENAATDDHDFLCRLAFNEGKFKLVRQETWDYRWHDRNVSLAFQEIADGKPPTHPYYLKRFIGE